MSLEIIYMYKEKEEKYGWLCLKGRGNNGSKTLIKSFLNVAERYLTADDLSMEEGSIIVNAKHSSEYVHEKRSKFNNTEQEQSCMNEIDDKKKSLFNKVSIDTSPNN